MHINLRIAQRKIQLTILILFISQFFEDVDCTCETATNKVQLFRYYNIVNHDHFYTTNWNELEGGRGDYRYEGVAGQVFSTPIEGTSALYRYYNPGNGDHFYTLNWGELGGGRGGYGFEGIQCFIYQAPTSGTLPLYRYYSPSTGDHFYTTNWSELGGGRIGYGSEGVAGYVCP